MRVGRSGPGFDPGKAGKASKAGGGKFAARLGGTQRVDAVDRVDAVESAEGADAVDAAFGQIASDLQEGKHGSLEEATLAFVQAVLRERWGRLDASDPGVQGMERYITNAMTRDPKMSERLQMQFDRYARKAARDASAPKSGREH